LLRDNGSGYVSRAFNDYLHLVGIRHILAAIAAFVTYYNYSRYHMALSNVTQAEVLNGRREQILQRRREVQLRTIDRRRRYNSAARELSAGSP
jgi:transposase InsO family protein